MTYSPDPEPAHVQNGNGSDEGRWTTALDSGQAVACATWSDGAVSDPARKLSRYALFDSGASGPVLCAGQALRFSRAVENAPSCWAQVRRQPGFLAGSVGVPGPPVILLYSCLRPRSGAVRRHILKCILFWCFDLVLDRDSCRFLPGIALGMSILC